MATFTDAEIAYLTDLGALEVTPTGTTVLAGLTQEETDFYMAYSRQRNGGHDFDAQDRYLALHDKHEAVRLSTVGAEAELRVLNPSKH